MPNTAYDNDQTLFVALHAGNEQAFTELYHRYYQRVFYFAQRYVGETDAQDIVAETFLQLWRKRTDFHQANALARFLFITARNRCHDFVRRAQVKNQHTAELAMLMNSPVHQEPFLEQQIRIEMIGLLSEQIDLLPDRIREVFLLSFKEGLKPAQIAERLNLSVKTVKNQKLSAIKLLKTALGDRPLQLSLLLLLLQIEGSVMA